MLSTWGGIGFFFPFVIYSCNNKGVNMGFLGILIVIFIALIVLRIVLKILGVVLSAAIKVIFYVALIALIAFFVINYLHIM